MKLKDLLTMMVVEQSMKVHFHEAIPQEFARRAKFIDEMEAHLMSEKVVDDLENFEIHGAVEDLYEHLNKVWDSIKEVHV